MNQKFPPPKVIAVDVDGTLQIRGEPNLALIEWCRARKDEGFLLMLWSSRGSDHAARYAEEFSVTGLFDLTCSKPGYIVDDQGWDWTKYTRILKIEKDEPDNEEEMA